MVFLFEFHLAYSYDTEAFAIADTMQFIRPPIRTICVGQAFGTAAMLLSLGQKGAYLKINQLLPLLFM